MKTDSQIQSDVMQAPRWEPSVTHELIGVSAKDGMLNQFRWNTRVPDNRI